ncbi:MAG: cytochrome c3 family protein, partial [Gemmatimonadales bacterium]
MPSFAMALILALPGVVGAQPARSDNPHGSLQTTTDCDACHTAKAWKPLKSQPDFNHNVASSFVLVGKHEEAKCKSCHLDLRFDTPKIAASDCASCHLDVHLGQLSSECANCHTTLDFADIPALAIHSRTSFPLSGSHLQISCESCHVDDRGGAYSTLATECVACHQADYVGAESVDHVSQNFPTDCERCHNTFVWSGGGGFDHVAASSGFALSGAHASLDCGQCHDPSSNALLFPPPSGQNDCVACHESDYERQHGGSGTPTLCADCHSDVAWENPDFEHVVASGGFALLGAHSTLDCTFCHDPSNNALLFPPPSDQNDCVACHQDDYDAQHSGTGFTTNCLECHTQTAWAGASFDHVTASGGFALLGAHSTLDCTFCHDPSN